MRIGRQTIDASPDGPADPGAGAGVGRVQARDVLVGTPSFLLVLAVLLHLLVGARFARTVPAERSTTRSVATNATVLVPGEAAPRRDVTLTRTRTVDPTVAPVPDVDAYIVSTSTRLPDGTFVDHARWTGVQERITGRVVPSPSNSELITRLDATGNTVEERRPLRGMGGVLLRFPRDTRERSQRRWDPVTHAVTPAEPAGEGRVGGARVLELRQRAEATAGGVRTRTDSRLSVRPETGAVVREDVHVQVRDQAGSVLLDARFVDDATSVRRASATVDEAVRRNWVLGTALPVVTAFFGMLAALVAVLEGRTRWLRGQAGRVRPEEAQ